MEAFRFLVYLYCSFESWEKYVVYSRVSESRRADASSNELLITFTHAKSTQQIAVLIDASKVRGKLSV